MTPSPDRAGPVDPGPPPTGAPPGRATGGGPLPDDTLPAGGVTSGDGGWRSTTAQGLLLARWVAGEVAAQWVERFTLWPWVIGTVGVVCLGLSLPVDPGWPLIVLGVVLVGAALVLRLAMAAVAALLRRLSLPRRARHLRRELSDLRSRLATALEEAGVPVSPVAAARFGWDLFRGRRPHSGVARDLLAVTARLGDVTELARLRDELAAAASRR